MSNIYYFSNPQENDKLVFMGYIKMSYTHIEKKIQHLYMITTILTLKTTGHFTSIQVLKL